jgi:hypothetical protein
MKKINQNHNQNHNQTDKNDALITLDQIEIEPLRDEELEGIVGGIISGSCSHNHCSN